MNPITAYQAYQQWFIDRAFDIAAFAGVEQTPAERTAGQQLFNDIITGQFVGWFF
jgi:hypothetical protein